MSGTIGKVLLTAGVVLVVIAVASRIEAIQSRVGLTKPAK
jgi:hypothetical protein